MRFCLACSVLLACAAARAGDLTVGFAEADITPGRRARSPSTWPASARTARPRRSTTRSWPGPSCWPTATQKIALVAVDVVGLFLPSVERVREKLPGFKYVLVSSTHNHEGPDTLGLWGPNPFTAGVDPDYLKKVEAGCVDGGEGGRRGAASRRWRGSAPPPARNCSATTACRSSSTTNSSRSASTTPKTEQAARRARAVELPPRRRSTSKNTEVSADFVGLHGEAPRAKSQAARSRTSPAPSAG